MGEREERDDGYADGVDGPRVRAEPSLVRSILSFFADLLYILADRVVFVFVYVHTHGLGDIGETKPKVPQRHALYVPSTRRKFSIRYSTKMSGTFVLFPY